MTKEELDQYNESLKSGSSYRPFANGTANHEALFYEVETLLAAGKQVVIVTYLTTKMCTNIWMKVNGMDLMKLYKI